MESLATHLPSVMDSKPERTVLMPHKLEKQKSKTDEAIVSDIFGAFEMVQDGEAWANLE